MAWGVNSLRLSHKMTIVGSIGVVGLLMVGGTYLVKERISSLEREAAASARSQAFVAMELDKVLLDARRAEKDFIILKRQSTVSVTNRSSRRSTPCSSASLRMGQLTQEVSVSYNQA
jgi:methyl-accepting chemotaxis protein